MLKYGGGLAGRSIIVVLLSCARAQAGIMINRESYISICSRWGVASSAQELRIASSTSWRHTQRNAATSIEAQLCWRLYKSKYGGQHTILTHIRYINQPSSELLEFHIHSTELKQVLLGSLQFGYPRRHISNVWPHAHAGRSASSRPAVSPPRASAAQTPCTTELGRSAPPERAPPESILFARAATNLAPYAHEGKSASLRPAASSPLPSAAQAPARRSSGALPLASAPPESIFRRLDSAPKRAARVTNPRTRALEARTACLFVDVF